MRDDIGDIEAFYDAEPGREHRRLDEHQLEFELTLRILADHLPDGARVLDLGAATGRYSIALAQAGHSVTAVDLSGELIEVARAAVAEADLANSVELHVGDARDLSFLGDARFDAVLVLGPLYHLIELADREMVLTQARDRLRPGGLVFSAFLSRLGVLGDFMRRVPSWIRNDKEVRSLMESGTRPHDAPRSGGFRGYFARVSEVTPLHESLGFKTLSVFGVEPAISADDESFNSLEGEDRDRWLNLLGAIADDPSVVGASRHFLYAGKKPEA